jgi:hypothetical protein
VKAKNRWAWALLGLLAVLLTFWVALLPVLGLVGNAVFNCVGQKIEGGLF